LKKRKIRITCKIIIITILNILLSGVLLKFIIDGQVNIGYSIILKLNKGNRLVNFLYLAIYLVVSLMIIREYYKFKIRNLYLSSSIQEVDEMTGIEFEYFLLYKFKQRRYKVKTTPVTGDYGADLVLKKRKEKIVVQAKRYQNDVGIAAVQEVIGSIAFYGATKGIVITNSHFTSNAIQLANANDIILWDRKTLIEELIQEEQTEGDLSQVQINPGSCPYCGRALVYREGKYGSFIGCSGYPKCKYTNSIDEVSINKM
jgi:restriction system protein